MSLNILIEPCTVPAGTEVARPPAETSAVSVNYSLAKVVAILTVTAGHWFTGTILWIPVTFGLMVFAFSSGYFTSAHYGPRVDRQRFWRKKLERLGLRYWILLGFIAALVALKGGTVAHWHSLVHLFGLSGVLNWANVSSASGMGAGLWFFTLLLLFYLTYPYLAQAVASKRAAVMVVAGGFVLAVLLEEQVKVGHELWLTTFGFVAGVAWGAHRPRLPAGWMLALTMLLWGLLLALNVLGIKYMNTVLIASGGLAVAIWLTVAELPRLRVLKGVAILDKYLLEIFLVHTYLFVHPTGVSGMDFAISLVLIMAVSVLLSVLADKVSARMFRERAGER
ncbi:acyltransferase family protein [Telluria aromaticivorans]|uniref:Acyltransferase family protein n=1 Tax=Telluria aromaticivorans TaxID=2725995 RepID=A0A7Y2K0C6_9BURK|nr:acyltransferase family protein [Telluria aromaticivorans]NNG24231.1 acyltransferase family protein [Telluria aromaticivorans]